MRIRAAEDFGAIARQRRRDLGLSQESVAQRAGVTRQWLVRFEQGNAEVAVSKAFAVLVELGLALRADAPSAATTQKPVYTVTELRGSKTRMDDARLARGREALTRLDAELTRRDTKTRDG